MYFLEVWSPRGEVAYVLDSNVLVSEFERKARYCDRFRINTFGKGINSFITAFHLHLKG